VQASCGFPVGQETTGVGGEERGGYDGGKKIKGRKRHLLVDTEGFLPSRQRSIAPRKVMDWDGIKELLRRADTHFPRLKHLWVDAGGYRGEDRGTRTGWRRSLDGAWIWSSVLAQACP
jgi:Transposase DDE domain